MKRKVVRFDPAEGDSIDRWWIARIADHCEAASKMIGGDGSINSFETRGLQLREYSEFPFGMMLNGRAPLPFSIQYRSGWPVQSLCGGGYSDGSGRPRWIPPTACVQWLFAIPVTQTIQGFDGNFVRVLPCCPIWPGFAINTIFYAAILWLLWAAPGAIRRLRRKQRGQCIHCGYDLRGLADQTTCCPECGAERMSKLHETDR